jgi:hypothetical protein
MLIQQPNKDTTPTSSQSHLTQEEKDNIEKKMGILKKQTTSGFFMKTNGFL